jgi:YfiH family protein
MITLQNFKQKTENKIFDLDIKKALDYELPMLKFQLFQREKGIQHGFSTRLGGVSTGIYESLNLSFTRGDDPASVLDNYRRVSDYFGVDLEHIVTSDQTHTTNVIEVTSLHGGSGITRERDFTDVDGMVTKEPGLLLATFYADCVPLYFYDPVHKAIGLSHSGWRGTVNRMGAATLERMKECFGTNPEDVIAAIGPSICQDCYEVSEDVAFAFKKEFLNPQIVLPGKKEGKYQLDLWKANREVLLSAGIKEENLAVTNICTCCNEQLLFSHRASQGRRGNLGAFLMLKG